LRLTDSKGIDTSPSFSPDGSKLAFVSERGGSPQIYILELLTKVVKRITFNGNYNNSPVFSPDGKKIAFTRLEGNVFRIYSINLDYIKIIHPIP